MPRSDLQIRVGLSGRVRGVLHRVQQRVHSDRMKPGSNLTPKIPAVCQIRVLLAGELMCPDICELLQHRHTRVGAVGVDATGEIEPIRGEHIVVTEGHHESLRVGLDGRAAKARDVREALVEESRHVLDDHVEHAAGVGTERAHVVARKISIEDDKIWIR